MSSLSSISNKVANTADFPIFTRPTTANAGKSGWVHAFMKEAWMKRLGKSLFDFDVLECREDHFRNEVVFSCGPLHDFTGNLDFFVHEGFE